MITAGFVSKPSIPFQSVMRNLARELELSPNLNIELNNIEVLSDAVDSMIENWALIHRYWHGYLIT